MSKGKKRKLTRRKKKDHRKFFSFLIVIIISAVLLAPFITKLIEQRSYPFENSDIVTKYCEEYGVPKELIYATIKVESNFDPNAVSEAGAIGLTQIMPDTLDWLLSKTGESYTPEDLKNPEVSIKYCTLFYSLLLEEFKDQKTATAAYHAGRGQVNEWLKNSEYSKDGKTLSKIPSNATSHYVDKVSNALNIYNEMNKEEK